MINDIEKQISNIVGLRKKQREQAINEVSLNLHRELKTLGYKVIERSFLKTFFDDSISIRTQNEILKVMLSYLISNDKFKQVIKKKQHNRFRIIPILKTYDDDGYSIMMKKNGYRTYHYKNGYDTENKIPKRVLIGITDINQNDEQLTEQADLIQNESNKPRSQQGLYCESNKSRVIQKQRTTLKAFEII